MKKSGLTRRELLQKAQYAAPLILTLKAAPSFARTGSENETASVPPKAKKRPKVKKKSSDSDG